MGEGFLTVELFLGEHVLPVKNATVLIKDTSGSILYELITDENGFTEKVPLEAPDKKNINDPNYTGAYFSIYDVEVPHIQGYRKAVIRNVQVFDTISSIQPIQLHPNSKKKSPDENTDEIIIPTLHGIDLQRDLSDSTDSVTVYNTRSVSITEKILANEVSIPDYITVHLGSPNAVGKNVRVSFKDYIKNVASSEIYPIWEESAIYANIYAQISFVLNRVYTVWYRCRGKDFDISNNTAYDQFFVEGRNIFENISQTVDGIFNTFIRRDGRKEPFFASYCNGTTSQCNGLSQFGSQSMALKKYAPIQILRYYYPPDVQIVESTKFTSSGVGTFGGIPLKEGSSGDDVRTMQMYLNRISGNFSIPAIPNPNGFFDGYTKAATIAFQKISNLTPDGVIGSSTWYGITQFYVAVKELAELTSEGERIGVGKTPPTTTVRLSSRGENVVELQFLLNYISEFYPSIPYVIQNGVFREDTQKSVKEFQKEFGLTPDGVVGSTTWRELYAVYYAINDAIDKPGIIPTPEHPSHQQPQYPGNPLKQGSKDAGVLLMQNYLNAVALTYPSIPKITADGIFGANTKSAVMAFQRQFGITADGIIGPMTWNKIVDVYENLAPDENLSFPDTPLRVGSRGNDVMLMQNYLKEISAVFPDIRSLTSDGVFGMNTQASVMDFQSLMGLTVDGIIGRNTWDKVVYVHNNMPANVAPRYPGTALKIGSRGNDVTTMQKYLQAIAERYPSIPGLNADGIFGPGTQASVVAFQKQFSLTADGVIGKNTWNKIISVYNMISMNMASISAYSINSGHNTSNNFNSLAMCLAFFKLTGR